MLWRNFNTPTVYQSCLPINLPEGVLISHNFAEPVRYISQAVHKQDCYLGATPLRNTNINLVLDTFTENLPIVADSWKQFTQDPSSGGKYLYSVAPAVYSLATSAVITWFLTIFVITNYMIKPSFWLQSSVVMASVFMLIAVIKAIVVLHHQQIMGFLHGESLLDNINHKVYLNVIDLFVTFFLQVNQVQIVMRLFSRQSDKRLIFLVGVSTSIISQVLWSISKFHTFADNAEAGKVIPAFTYLIRIAMSISYAAIFTAFLITRVKTLMLHPSIWAISVLSLVLIYAPVAFFVADVSSPWMYDLSEIFSTVSYVICVVIPWEWCNKYNVIRKIQEKEGVLGRKFYEDEMYELDKFELFVEEESDGDSPAHSQERSLLSKRSLQPVPTTHTSHSSGANSGSGRRKSENGAIRDTLASGVFFVRDGFVKMTDFVIATAMTIPRSVSAGSPLASSRLRGGGDAFYAGHLKPKASTNRNSETRDNDRRNGDVFVYGRKDMTITFDD